MGTYNSNILPSATGLQLGSPSQRWKIYASDIDTLGELSSDSIFSVADYASIQLAITAAGSTGTVIIPSDYSGTDNFTNPSNIPILDFRGGSGRWRGYYNVRDFGAVGDGVHDDTANIQACLNLFSNTSLSGEIFFPTGVYKITSTLNYVGIGPSTSIHLSGVVSDAGGGSGAALKWTGASGGCMFKIVGSNMSIVENIHFNGNNIAKYGLWINYTPDSLAFKASAYNTIRGCTFQLFSGAGSACVAVGDAVLTGLQASDMYIEHCRMVTAENGFLTLSGSNVKNFIIRNCNITGCSRGINWLQSAGFMNLNSILFGNNTVADVAFASGPYAQCNIISCGSEGSKSFVKTAGTSAGVSYSLTVMNSYWYGTCDATDEIINGAAALTLIGNIFSNDRTGVSTPKVILYDPRGDTSNYSSGVMSFGNIYINADNVDGKRVFTDTGGNELFAQSGYYYVSGFAMKAFSFGDLGGIIGALVPLKANLPIGGNMLFNSHREAGNSSSLTTQNTTGIGLLKGSALWFRNNANAADINGLKKDGSDVVQVGDANGVKLAASASTAVSQLTVYTPSLTPASVSANTSAEQTFSVSGLSTSDKIFIAGPALTAGTAVVGWRVSATDTLRITFGNFTAGSLTPAAGTYNIVAIRS